MTNGKVKWYNDNKGFGFILTEDGDDIFVHHSGIKQSMDGLQPDESVTFEIKQGDKGLYAINVRSSN